MCAKEALELIINHFNTSVETVTFGQIYAYERNTVTYIPQLDQIQFLTTLIASLLYTTPTNSIDRAQKYCISHL